MPELRSPVALALLLAASALACAARLDAATIRAELVRQTGRPPLKEFEWNLGLTARLAMRALGTRPEQVLRIEGLSGLEVALYDADPSGPAQDGPLDLSALDRRGWETVVRYRDPHSSALVVVRPSGERIRELVLVGAGRNQVVFARLEGRLDPGLPAELERAVRSEGPEATRDKLVGATAGGP